MTRSIRLQADAELVLQQLAHAAQAAVAQMVDIIAGHKAIGQRVHIVDGGEDILHNDMLGHQRVSMQLALLDQLLALILAHQLLQHVKADTLLDAALLAGIEVHVVGHVAHAVAGDLQHLAGVQCDGDLLHAHGVHQCAVGGGQHAAFLKQQLAGPGHAPRRSASC